MNVSGESSQIIKAIASREGFSLSSINSLAGGDINEVFLLKTSQGKQVLKLNSATRFPGMFEAEKAGLEALRESDTFLIPEVLGLGETRGEAYLLLEYLPKGHRPAGFWEEFAENLANLHRCTAAQFGFTGSNYIGSLPQFNTPTPSAGEFYVSQRLEPQFKMAQEQGFSFPNLSQALRTITAEIPSEPPALVHGDLWNGNYLISSRGYPCLIDPAVAYAPREMDLAMMKLFGGFSEEVFRVYEEIFPLDPGFPDRIALWQLYYLLVHLNIFGSGYLPAVERILGQYS